MNLWNIIGKQRTSAPQASPVDLRTRILTEQGRWFATQTLKVLSQDGVVSALRHWSVSARYIGIGVRLADATKLPRAMKLSNSIGYAAGVGDGSPEPPVIAVPLGFLLYFQFQLPEHVLYQGQQVRLWKDIHADDPRLAGGGLGLGPRGLIVRFDWNDAPHALVAGMTNSGKSTLVTTILWSLIKQYSPQDLQLVLCDPNYDYEAFENEAHLALPIAHTPDQIVAATRWFAHETATRAEQNQRDAVRTLFVMDEADRPYALGEPENLHNIQGAVRIGRAFSCNVLIATHKPDAPTLGSIREELDNRFLGKVATSSISGQLGAGLDLHKLSSRGDFVHAARAASIRFQAAWVDDGALTQLPRRELPDFPELPAVTSQVMELDPERTASYLYAGGNITAKQAFEKLGLKRAGHEKHLDFARKVLKHYKVLQEKGDWQ